MVGEKLDPVFDSMQLEKGGKRAAKTWARDLAVDSRQQ